MTLTFVLHTFFGGPQTGTKDMRNCVCQNEHRPRYRVAHRNTSQLFIGVNLLKIVRGAVKCTRMTVGGVRGPKIFNFIIRNVKLLCIFDWTLKQGDSTATVTMTLHHSWYFQKRKKLRPRRLGAPECWGPLCTAQPAQPIATPLSLPVPVSVHDAFSDTEQHTCIE